MCVCTLIAFMYVYVHIHSCYVSKYIGRYSLFYVLMSSYSTVFVVVVVVVVSNVPYPLVYICQSLVISLLIVCGLSRTPIPFSHNPLFSPRSTSSSASKGTMLFKSFLTPSSPTPPPPLPLLLSSSTTF